MRNSSRNWAWDTMKAEAGADFIIMPLSVLRRMGSWWPSGTVFPPLPAPAILDYQPRNRRRTSARGGAAFGPNGIIRTRSLHCGSSLPANCSGSYLTVPSAARAGRLIFRIHVHFGDAGLRAGMVGSCLPCAFEQLHSAEFLHCDAAPVAWRSGRLQSTATLSSVLIAQHPGSPPGSGPTCEGKTIAATVMNDGDGPSVHHRSSHQGIRLLRQWVSSTHPPHITSAYSGFGLKVFSRAALRNIFITQ